MQESAKAPELPQTGITSNCFASFLTSCRGGAAWKAVSGPSWVLGGVHKPIHCPLCMHVAQHVRSTTQDLTVLPLYALGLCKALAAPDNVCM